MILIENMVKFNQLIELIEFKTNLYLLLFCLFQKLTTYHLESNLSTSTLMFSGELENVQNKLIGSDLGRHRVRQPLKTTSADTRYNLSKHVRERVLNTWVRLHRGAYANNLESSRRVLEGFTSSQKHEVLRRQ